MKSINAKNIIEKIKDKKGSLLWELMLVLAILFMFLYSCITFLGAFVQFESLSYATKSIARSIEVTGQYSNSTIEGDIERLLSDKLVDAECEIEVSPLDGMPQSFANNLQSQGKIQLRQTFKITIKATYPLQLFGSSEGNLISSWVIDVPMSYTVTGMSEVYWRD